MIKGGYYIKARKIQESEVAHWPPHVREIWDWLLRDANWKDKGKIKRGQTVRTIKEIQDGLSWTVGWRKETYSTALCENSMKMLRKAGMITTKKTGRGAIITICNYDEYQNPDNYESRMENRTESRTEAEQKPNQTEEGGIRGEKEKGFSCETEKRTKPSENDKKITPGQFDKFWKLYPGKKADKGKCITKWKTICNWKNEPVPTWGEIRLAIHQQKKTERWVDGFIPLPHTWLNGRRWLDDPGEMDRGHFTSGKVNGKTNGQAKLGAKAPEGYFKNLKYEEI